MPGLTRSARRRMLERGGPGTVYVMGRAQTYGLRGPGRGVIGPKQRVHTGSLIDIGFSTDVLAWDLDCRELVRRLQVDLAIHYMEMLTTGRQADGRPMPAKSEKQMRRDKRRQWYRENILGEPPPPVQIGAGRLGVRTGAMAGHYRWGRISGHALSARGMVLPFTGRLPGERHEAAVGRAKWASRAKPDWGVDLVSAGGAATRVISRALNQWIRDAKADQRGRVRTALRPDTRRGGLRWGRPSL